MRGEGLRCEGCGREVSVSAGSETSLAQLIEEGCLDCKGGYVLTEIETDELPIGG